MLLIGCFFSDWGNDTMIFNSQVEIISKLLSLGKKIQKEENELNLITIFSLLFLTGWFVNGKKN